jgi:hypothetical protein
MVDIQTISIAIASTSVVAGVVYYALQLRHQARTRQDMVKTRQADLLMRLYLTYGSKEFQEALWTVQKGLLTFVIQKFTNFIFVACG